MKTIVSNIAVLLTLLALTGCSSTGANNRASVELLPGESQSMGVSYLQTNGSVTLTATNVGKIILADRARTSARQLLSVTALRGFTYTRTNTLGGVVVSSIDSADADPDDKAISASGTAIGNVGSGIIKP